MPHTSFWFAGSTEEFAPADLVAQARAAAAAGFDGTGLSDHWAPWFPDGRGTQAWVTLGAIGQQHDKPLGTGVTPIVHHYHPGLVAQAFMSLEELYPSRVFLGAGSGESVNESPLGLDWPSIDEQHERFTTGLEAITRLWDGETVTMDAGWFALKEAKLYSRARSRPKLFVSAFGPKAAQIAGRFGDGLWTLGDPEQAPEVVDAYREACVKHGREPGTIIMQSGMAWADDADAVLRGAARWKPTQLSELYIDDISDPADMQRRADAQLTDEQFAREGFIVSADPAEHVDRVRQIADLGADVVCLQLIGHADPMGTIDLYGREVLPALRGVAA
ncbi:MAG: LLM class flavin-dependent oxidoreductase [Solirubrobacteraceae bacterium]|nr:LLM class flavin-dependent oxidoreductase [Solirubrobacteraceae bacterium]